MSKSQTPSWIRLSKYSTLIVKLVTILSLFIPISNADNLQEQLQSPKLDKSSESLDQPLPVNSDQPSDPSQSPIPSPSPSPSPTPEIQTNFIPIRIIRRNRKNQVFLINSESYEIPDIGKVIYVLRGRSPLMAFRVIRHFEGQQYFAAKKIKAYTDSYFLDSEEQLIAVEREIIPPPPPTPSPSPSLSPTLSPSPSPTQEIAEWTAIDPSEQKSPDPSPTPSQSQDATLATEDLEDDLAADELEKLMIEEPSPIDLNRHWVSIGLAYLRGLNATGGSYYFSSGSLRYGYSIGRRILLNSPKLQDSLILETGLFLYKAINFATLGDSFSVISIPGHLRYNLSFSEDFGIYFYGGINQGIVLSASSATATALAVLGSMQLAFGGGLLFQVGPSWYTRLDLGIDVIGMALVLRF